VFFTFVETSNLNTDTCNFESSQKEETSGLIPLQLTASLQPLKFWNTTVDSNFAAKYSRKHCQKQFHHCE